MNTQQSSLFRVIMFPSFHMPFLSQVLGSHLSQPRTGCAFILFEGTTTVYLLTCSRTQSTSASGSPDTTGQGLVCFHKVSACLMVCVCVGGGIVVSCVGGRAKLCNSRAERYLLECRGGVGWMLWYLGEVGMVQVGVAGGLGAYDRAWDPIPVHSGLSHIRVKASAIPDGC